MLKGWESRKGLSLGAKEAAMERIMSGLESWGGTRGSAHKMLGHWTERASR